MAERASDKERKAGTRREAREAREVCFLTYPRGEAFTWRLVGNEWPLPLARDKSLVNKTGCRRWDARPRGDFASVSHATSSVQFLIRFTFNRQRLWFAHPKSEKRGSLIEKPTSKTGLNTRYFQKTFYKLQILFNYLFSATDEFFSLFYLHSNFNGSLLSLSLSSSLIIFKLI